MDPRFLSVVRDVVGSGHLLDDPELTATHFVDWTGRFRCEPTVVLRPGTTTEVAAVVQAARSFGVALTPQGGNTGLVGGATPMDGGAVVDLRRLDRISALDATAGQMTAGAGARIEAVQSAARDIGWTYGVDWAARGSATVGGSVATDAGGLRFVRHGSTRRQLLGIEAVLGSGVVVRHLPEVEKDNTGYDLAAVLCGSEGTLGLVTAVRLRLVAPPGPAATALVGFDSTRSAIESASILRRVLPGLEAVEFMMAPGINLVREAFAVDEALPPDFVAALLIEASATDEPEALLQAALAGLDGITSSAVATDGPRRRRLWRNREEHTAAIARLGPVHKLDVTLPMGALAGFVDDVAALVAGVDTGATVWCFGHAADGNVHVNVTGVDPDDQRVDEVVLTEVVRLGGSISAEHGIGRAKRPWLPMARSVGDISAMRSLKAAWDPDGICNPGVLLA